MSSPLILGLDVTDDTRLGSVWSILSNKAAIAVNQNWAGHPGRLINDDVVLKAQTWAKAQPGGAQAMLFFSRSDDPIDYTVQLDSLGLDWGTYTAHDIWDGSVRAPPAAHPHFSALATSREVSR